ncbi:MAG: energy transducer TonB [Candidatus Kryptonium sp.]
MPVIKKPEADLRLRWRKWIELGLVIALLISIVAFRFFPKDLGRAKKLLTVEQEIIKPEEIPQTRQENRPPPPPRPPIPIEAPSDEALEDINIDISSELDITKEVAPPPPNEDLRKEEDIPLKEQFFMVVEEMPEIIGGLESIQRNVVYPEIAIEPGVEGTVYVMAFVDENGNVVRADVVKGIGAGCDEAAVAAVMKAKFKPGKQRGKPVKVRVMIPIRFKLKK